MKTRNNKREGRNSAYGHREKRSCPLCAAGIKIIDYKDVNLLINFLTPGGAILPRRVTGVTNANQRKITQAIKRARVMALLPFRVV